MKMVPVDSKSHTGKGWRQKSGYTFAAAQALVPLTAVEFPKAAVAMPIAFIENAGRYLPVAVASPVQGRNFYIAPTGQWLGSDVPAALRSYRFRLGTAEGSSELALWVDEDSGWVVEAGPGVTRFFEENGSPSGPLSGIIQLLQELEQARALTSVAVAPLVEARLIEPWALTATIGNQQTTAAGLHRVNESALNALDEQTFMRLRKTSSLAMAYAQLISMNTVGLFQSLSRAQQQMSDHALPQASSLFPTDDGGTIRFN